MPIYENEYPVPVTGSVFVINQSSGSGAGGNVNITGTITLPVSATNPVTASVSNFPADQVVHGNVNITASVPIVVTSSAGLPVWVTGAVTVNTGSAVAGYGTGSAIATNNTGTLMLGTDGTDLLAIKTNAIGNPLINIVGTITLPVSATNPVTASIANFPSGFNVNLTGSVTVPVSATNPITASISNLPTTQSVKIDQSITVPVSMTNAVLTASVGNFPAGFNSNITASITLPVSATNPVTASISNFPTGFNVNVTASVTQSAQSFGSASVGGWLPMKVASDGVQLIGGDSFSTASAAWTNATALNTALALTGNLEYANTAVQLVYAGSLTGGQIVFEVSQDNTNWVATDFSSVASGTTATTVFLSGKSGADAYQMFTGGFNYIRARLSSVITGGGSVTVSMVGSLIGTETSVNVQAPGGLLVYGSGPGGALYVTGAQGSVVTASIANFPTTFPGNVNITGTITLPVSATNPITASVANFPTGFNANITGAIGLTASVNFAATSIVTASISNFPTTFPGNVNITGTITLPVSATNPITASVANWPTTQDVRLTSASNNAAPVNVSGGITIVSASNATGPVWITGSVLVNTGSSSGGGVQYGTGSTTFLTGTLFLASGTAGGALPLKVDAAGQLYIANPGGAAAPTSGTTTTVTATGTVGGVGLLASNANRKGATIFNNGSTNLYIGLGTTATTSNFSALLVPSALYEVPYGLTGPISGAWAGTPTGNALITEVV